MRTMNQAAEATISRRAFLATSAAGTAFIAAGTVAGVAATSGELGKLSYLIKRHRIASDAVMAASNKADAADTARSKIPVVYQTSAGSLTFGQERMALVDGELLPAAIVNARASRHLVEPFTREEALAFVASSRATYEADIAAYHAAHAEFRRLGASMGVDDAERAYDAACEVVETVWEELLNFPCDDVATIRAKLAYVFSRWELKQRLDVMLRDNPDAEINAFLRSLGASAENVA